MPHDIHDILARSGWVAKSGPRQSVTTGDNSTWSVVCPGGVATMVAYMARRTLLAAFTILVISFIAFLIVQLPEGDAVDYYLEQVHRQTWRLAGKVRAGNGRYSRSCGA